MALTILPSFSKGEVTPYLYGRVDLATYQVACRTLRNFKVRPYGGVSRRPGTQYLFDAYGVDPSKNRLIPFQFSATEGYVLEFGDYRMRVIYSDAVVHHHLVDSTRYRWLASGSGTAEYYLDLLAGGDPRMVEPLYIYLNGTLATAGTAGSLAVSQWDWADNDTLGYSTVYVRLADGTDPDTKADGYVHTDLVIESPYSHDDLLELRYCQSADVVWFTHYAYPVYKLTRTAADRWTFEEQDFISSVAPPAGLTATPSGFTGNARNVYYAVSAVDEDGAESLRSTGVVAATAWPWTSGAYVSLAWSGVSGAEEYRVYKNNRGNYGWIGTLCKDYVKCPNGTSISGGDYSASYPAASAFDGSLATYWASSQTGAAVGGAAYIGQDFGSGVTKSVNKFRFVQSRADLGNAYAVEALKLDYSSDGSAWTTLEEFAVEKLAGVWQEYQIDATTTTVARRYWRLLADEDLATNMPWLVAEAEFQEVGVPTAFTDDNITPDAEIGPMQSTNPFDGEDNRPGAVGLYQQRLVLARTNNAPQTVWATETGVLDSMGTSIPLKDSDAIEATIASGRVDEILHIFPLRDLILFTAGSEWTMRHGDNSDALTPTSVRFDINSYWGSTDVPPLVAGDSILFVDGTGRAVRDMFYSLEQDGYHGNCLSVTAEHLFRWQNAFVFAGSIKQWCFQKRPDSIVWLIDENYRLRSLTYMREQQVIGWARHDSGLGPFTAGTDDLFLSCCSIFGSSSVSSDPVYFLMCRYTKVGTTVTPKYYIEKMLGGDHFLYQQQTQHLDSLKTHYLGGGTTSIDGMEHLAGRTVTAVLENASAPNDLPIVENLVVSDAGVVTLPISARTAVIGLPYISDLETLDLDMGGGTPGTIQARKKKISKVTLRVADSGGPVYVGPDSSSLSELVINPESTVAVPIVEYDLVTGDYEGDMTPFWGKTGRVFVRTQLPLTLNIVAIIPEVTLGAD